MEDLMTFSIHKKDEAKVPLPISGIHLYHDFSRGMFHFGGAVMLEYSLDGGRRDSELFRELFDATYTLAILIENSVLRRLFTAA